MAIVIVIIEFVVRYVEVLHIKFYVDFLPPFSVPRLDDEKQKKQDSFESELHGNGDITREKKKHEKSKPEQK